MRIQERYTAIRKCENICSAGKAATTYYIKAYQGDTLLNHRERSLFRNADVGAIWQYATLIQKHLIKQREQLRSAGSLTV